MKNLIKIGILTLSIAFIFTSCEEDPISGPGTPGTPGVNDGDPEISFVSEAGFISSAAEIPAGSTFSVKLTAEKGDADLTGVIFSEDGSNLSNPETRITVDGAAVTDNTVATLETEKEGFTWNVDIVAHTDVKTVVYGFILVDANNVQNVVDVAITTTQSYMPPSIGITGSGMLTDVTPGSKTCIAMNVTAGNPALNQLAVFAFDGNGGPFLVNSERLCFGTATQEVEFAENPLTLEGDDRLGFEKRVCVRAQTDESFQDYVIALYDEGDSVHVQGISIDTRPAGNPVTTLEGVLFNAGGPAGTGGLDMDSGDGTGSSDSSAELKDEGIDINLPNSSNWIQKISGANGTEVRQLIPNQNGLLESFSFESVTTDAGIAGVWGNGIGFSTTNNDGDLISNIVNVGDTFVALRDGKYYLFIIKEVNATTDNNDDNYVLDIKF